ncbi:MAG: hypothetical protein HZY73_02245 [Micropruina sp.]|nr:MAG: hypothetical protein HZY73_02245 [Micropruina sp.]
MQVHFPYAKGSEGVPTLDGTGFLGQSQSGRVNLSHNATGALLRTYSLPTDFSSCRPVRNWDADTFTEACYARSSGASAMSAQDLAGGAPRRLTYTSSAAPLGYIDVVSTPSGRVAIAANETDYPAAGRLVDKRSFRPFRVNQKDLGPIAIVGTKVIYHEGAITPDTDALRVWSYSQTTGRLTLLAGGEKNGGHAVSVSVIDKTA